MTSSSTAFAKAREEGRAALVGYLPAGFPTVEGSIASRSARGGTALDRVTEQLAEVRQAVADHRGWLG